MTAEQARTFEAGERESSIARFSAMRAARVAVGAHAPDCRCEPYRDVFTAGRWRAQNRHPRKGTKSFQLPIWRALDVDQVDPTADPNAKRRRLVRSRAILFCRCQTAENGHGTPYPYDVPADLVAAERAEFARHDQASAAAADAHTRPQPQRQSVTVIENRVTHCQLAPDLVAQLVDAIEPAGQHVRAVGPSFQWANDVRDAVAAAGATLHIDGDHIPADPPDPSRWLVIALGYWTDEQTANICGNHARVMAAFGTVCGVFLFPTGSAARDRLERAAAEEGLQAQFIDIGQIDAAPKYNPAVTVARLWRAAAA